MKVPSMSDDTLPSADYRDIELRIMAKLLFEPDAPLPTDSTRQHFKKLRHATAYGFLCPPTINKSK
jgi:hypothetical protein